MARKQIILLVVEGPSDQTALEAVFERIFNKADHRRRDCDESA